jgi:hypothetical protein
MNIENYPGFIECEYCPRKYGDQKFEDISLYTVFYKKEEVARKYMKAHVLKRHPKTS